MATILMFAIGNPTGSLNHSNYLKITCKAPIAHMYECQSLFSFFYLCLNDPSIGCVAKFAISQFSQIPLLRI